MAKGIDFDKREKKYVLVEFPYPSGEGLHVGHAFSMTGADVYARFMRKKGFNVMFPMGYDAFGLPAENYAIKTGIQPQITTDRVTKLIRKQMNRMAFSFDWDREINTTLPDYYKWTQWIFIKLFEKGLARKEEMPINWCPSCKIGLANEEVVDGNCERCGAETSKRNISQWVVKITEYADRLIEGLKETDFIEKVKAAQVNWIDRKYGRLIKFAIKELKESRTLELETNISTSDSFVEVFTTRGDTLGGVEFVVVAPEHELAQELKESRTQELKMLSDYLENYSRRDVKDRSERKKTGVLLPIKVINPLNNREIPVYVADYVSMDFGTGAIMGVPSLDARDRDFAKELGIGFDPNFVPSENNLGEKKVTYHLRDWIFSRQHYWGEPIPMVWCEVDGWVSVPEEQLPVVLPEVEKYQPTETGESPLANITDWVNTTCPKCGGEAKRETDTMPNWAGSDWYFLRYIDNKNDKVLADMEKMKYWLPVDIYIGGDEHNTLHLLYSRFIYQFLWDLGVVPKEIPEPYKKRLSHGVILAPDGKRMSKSKGNVIAPEEMIEKYGTDVVRTYMMFMGPFDATMAWNERSLVGVKRFVEKFFNYVEKELKESRNQELKTEQDLSKSKILINRLVKVAGEDLESFKFNTVVARLMETLNNLCKEEIQISKEDLGKMVIVLSVFAPLVTEELWSLLGNTGSVHEASWPMTDEKYLVDEDVNLSVAINGKMRAVIAVAAGAKEEIVVGLAKREEKVTKYLNEGKILKTIFIKDRMLNFVVS
ncbi:TPA: leucine--tRNA ligase [Candidatus Collierbacteria bacterium]|nr:leucine--tRNA ligase [Candidatus Collierbacteria bacterium]HCX25393.1 leucine--tRNA ligase [Candidatus Collierbacteria bacterium]